MQGQLTFTPLDLPAIGGQLLPGGQLGAWLQETHARGRRRLRAIAALHERAAPLGLSACVLVGGPWLAGGGRHPGTWRIGPWEAGGDGAEPLWAEGAGAVDPGWIEALTAAVLADPERRRPGAAPRLWRVRGEERGASWVLDPSLTGRRQGLVLLRAEGGSPVLEALARETAAAWSALIVAGLLRGDLFRTHWETLSQALIRRRASSWDPLSPSAERPVNPQEVVARLAEVASALADDAARAFECATVGIFMPDPDDEYVYCLGAAGSARYAYDAGLHADKPRLRGVGFGLTASYAVGAAFHPAGSPVVVRALADRAALESRYRDLGFDEELIAAGAGEQPPETGPFLGERFVHADRAERARRGPWVFTAQQLPRALSPSGRNLVVRFQGRTVSHTWATPDQLSRTSRDRQNRMAAMAMRVHAEICRRFAEGLGLWREGLRGEVLRELSAGRRWAALCQTLSAWLSARVVSLFAVAGNELSLRAWSLPADPPELRFDAGAELLDARELRLLQAPLYPRRSATSEEGFLGWVPFVEAVGGPAESVGTVPVLAGGRAVGLLRVDGAMSLFGGHIRRQSPQPGLHHHRPEVLPAHLRPALEELARLLALAMEAPARGAEGGWSDWTPWVRRALAGQIPPERIAARLEALEAAAPTRAAAAALVGVHRNTLRRQLAALRERV